MVLFTKFLTFMHYNKMVELRENTLKSLIAPTLLFLGPIINISYDFGLLGVFSHVIAPNTRAICVWILIFCELYISKFLIFDEQVLPFVDYSVSLVFSLIYLRLILTSSFLSTI